MNRLWCLDRDKFFTLAPPSNIRGHNFKLTKAFCKTNQMFNFCSNRVVVYWNSLSSEGVYGQSLNIFVEELNKVDFTKFWLIK